MKKMIIILLAFIICLQFSALAQNARVGFSGGVTISDLRGNQNQMNSATKAGAVLGLLVDLPLTSHLTFQPSLSYIQKGNLNKEDANEKIYYATRYAELSPNFLYNFSSSGKGIYVGAGPYIDFNVPSKKVTDKKEGATTTADLTFGETIDKDLRGIDYGVNFLAGFKFSKCFFLSATYGLGLRNLATGEDVGDREIKNMCFGIQLGVLINNK
jgi:hypothetical protein